MFFTGGSQWIINNNNFYNWYAACIRIVGETNRPASYNLIYDNTMQMLNTNIGHMLGFSIVKENHPLLQNDFNKTIVKNKFTINIVDTGQGFSEMIRGKKYKKMRNNLNRYKSRAQEFGDIEFEIIQKHSDLITAFEDFVDFEVKGWKGTTQYAMRKNKITYNFYRSIIYGFALLNDAVIFKLWAGDELLSSELCINIDDTMYSLKVVYNEEYFKMSPGTLLTKYILKEYFPSNNIRYLNTVGPAEWFAKIWHPLIIETYKVNIFPDSINGNILKQAYKFYAKLKVK